MPETPKFEFYLPVDAERGWAGRARAAFTKIDLLLGALLNADGSVGHGHLASDIIGLSALLAPKLEEVQHDNSLLGRGTAADPLRFNYNTLPPAPAGGLQSVSRDSSLSGNGTPGSPLGLAQVRVVAPLTGQGTAASPIGLDGSALGLRVRVAETESNLWTQDTNSSAYLVTLPPPPMVAGGYAILTGHTGRLSDNIRTLMISPQGWPPANFQQIYRRPVILQTVSAQSGYDGGTPPESARAEWLVFEPR